MSSAVRADASIDTAIKTTRLPSPSAATTHVLSRIRPPCFQRTPCVEPWASCQHLSPAKLPRKGGSSPLSARWPRCTLGGILPIGVTRRTWEGTMADVRRRVIVLANRAPFKHELSRGRIITTRSSSGLVTALEPLLDAYSGTWVAHAAGSADTSV